MKEVTAGKPGEIALSGGVQILSLLGAVATGVSGIAFATFGAGSTVLLSAWQMEQQRKFEERVSERLASIDEAKLDKDVLKSSEFKELVIRVCSEARSTASPRKQRALAKGLINSALYPTSQLAGKLIFIRMVSQMSDEELRVLEAVQDIWESSIPNFEEIALAKQLEDLDISQILEACEGLSQLRVLETANSGTWTLSRVGRKLLSWISGKEEQKDFEYRQRMYVSQINKDVDRKIYGAMSDMRSEQIRSMLRAANL